MSVLRKSVLGLALLVTAVASFVDGPWWPQQQDDASARKTAARTADARSVSARAGTTAVLAPSAARDRYGPSTADLFAARSRPVVPVAPQLQEVAAPVAPPLPFRYLGKMFDGPEVVAFLAEGTRTLLLRRGDVVANYKVVEVTAEQMTLVYLPLNQTQKLPFGSAH